MDLPENEGSRDNSDQLHGWKEIAGYIGKGVRQAQRWEKLGMPVNRVGGMDGVVFAYRAEIDRWRLSGAGESAQQSSPDPEQSDTLALAAITLHPGAVEEAGRRWVWWGVLGSMALLVSMALAYAYVSRKPLDILLQSQSAVPQGGSFTFEATGGGDDLQLVHRVFRNPRGGELLVSPPVPRGPDGRFVWVYSTDCLTTPGLHDVFLADSDGTVLTESVRFEVKPHPGCAGPVPDLQAVSIGLGSPEVQAGAHVTVSFVLSNRGARAAYPSTTRLRLSQSPLRTSITDIRLGDVPAPLLEPGEEMAFESDLRVPADTAPGVYYVWVVADNGGDNVEALTHNNYVKSVPLMVIAPSQ